MLGNGIRSATTQNRMQTQGRGRRTNSLMEKVIFCLGGKDRCRRNECLGPKDRGDEGANAAEQSPVSPRHWSHRPEGLAGQHAPILWESLEQAPHPVPEVNCCAITYRNQLPE